MSTIASFASAGLTLAFMAFATPSFASPVGGLKGVTTSGESMVVKTHGCHRSCEWGPGRYWHRHIGAFCRPVRCVPRAAYPNRCWVDARGIRHCRW